MSNALSHFARRLEADIQDSAGWTKCQANCPEPEAGSRFETLALELFALQHEHNAPYRHFCERSGTAPDSVAAWTAIPAMPVAGFKELELTSLTSDARTTVFHSSGTTRQRPSRHFHHAGSLALYEASLRRGFQRHVLAGLESASAPLMALTPSPKQAPHSSLVHMLAKVMKERDATGSEFTGRIDASGAWSIDLGVTLDSLSRAVAAGHAVVLAGTAFNFVHLLDELASRGLRLALPAGSRVMETGGYKGQSRSLARQELHAALTGRLGVPRAWIVSEYGMSELSSQAYDCVAGSAEIADEGGRVFRFPPWARVQIVSPETGREVAEGETGLIRVFDLANVWSVMAVQTEDLGRRRGAGFELLGRATLAEPRGCSLLSA